jgi:hypothetical protein
MIPHVLNKCNHTDYNRHHWQCIGMITTVKNINSNPKVNNKLTDRDIVNYLSAFSQYCLKDENILKDYELCFDIIISFVDNISYLNFVITKLSENNFSYDKIINKLLSKSTITTTIINKIFTNINLFKIYSSESIINTIKFVKNCTKLNNNIIVSYDNLLDNCIVTLNDVKNLNMGDDDDNNYYYRRSKIKKTIKNTDVIEKALLEIIMELFNDKDFDFNYNILLKLLAINNINLVKIFMARANKLKIPQTVYDDIFKLYIDNIIQSFTEQTKYNNNNKYEEILKYFKNENSYYSNFRSTYDKLKIIRFTNCSDCIRLLFDLGLKFQINPVYINILLVAFCCKHEETGWHYNSTWYKQHEQMESIINTFIDIGFKINDVLFFALTERHIKINDLTKAGININETKYKNFCFSAGFNSYGVKPDFDLDILYKECDKSGNLKKIKEICKKVKPDNKALELVSKYKNNVKAVQYLCNNFDIKITTDCLVNILDAVGGSLGNYIVGIYKKQNKITTTKTKNLDDKSVDNLDDNSDDNLDDKSVDNLDDNIEKNSEEEPTKIVKTLKKIKKEEKEEKVNYVLKNTDIIVFSGVRDANLEEQLEKLGVKVAQTVTKSTTMLLVKNKETTNKKTVKYIAAEKNLIPILELQDFKNKYINKTVTDKKEDKKILKKITKEENKEENKEETDKDLESIDSSSTATSKIKKIIKKKKEDIEIKIVDNNLTLEEFVIPSQYNYRDEYTVTELCKQVLNTKITKFNHTDLRKLFFDYLNEKKLLMENIDLSKIDLLKFQKIFNIKFIDKFIVKFFIKFN